MNRLLILAALVGATTAPLSAQQVVGLWDFDNSDVSSTQPGNSTVSDLTISNTFVFGQAGQSDRWLCLTTDWNNTGGSISFTVTPNPGRTINFTRFSWNAVTNAPGRTDSVQAADVKVNGNVVETFDPLTHRTTNVVDLSGVADAQNVVAPLTIEICFTGNPRGQTSYEIGMMKLESEACVDNPATSGRIIRMPIPGCDSDWRALDGFVFIERGDGTAAMSGALENVGDPCKRLSVDINFTDRIDPFDASYPPAGSPLVNALVTGNGVDTNTWHYYETFSGTMRGRLCWEGAELAVSRRAEPFQIGFAANLEELAEGGSSSFDVNIVTQPTTGQTIAQFDRGDIVINFSDNCLCLDQEVALWENYGTGQAGCAGVPSFIMEADPLIGTDPVLTVGNTGTDTRLGAIFWSLAPADIFFPSFGINFLVGLPPVSVTNFQLPPGGFSFTCAILNDNCQSGVDIYAQAICMDPCPPLGFAYSRGLRMRLGNL